MTTEEIQRRNQAITQFMGYHYAEGTMVSPDQYCRSGWYKGEGPGVVPGEKPLVTLAYHSSWDQLIPVLEQVNSLQGMYITAELEEHDVFIHKLGMDGKSMYINASVVEADNWSRTRQFYVKTLGIDKDVTTLKEVYFHVLSDFALLWCEHKALKYGKSDG